MAQMREPNGKFAKKGSPTATKVAGTKGGLPKKNKTKVKLDGLVNRFALIADQSGSMRQIINQARNAHNSYLDSLRENAKKSGQATFVTQTRFGTGGVLDITIDYENKPIDSALGLGHEYRCVGGTPMFDAINMTINSLLKAPADDNTSYVVITTTDGQDEHSRQIMASDLNKRIKDLQATGRWTFVFLVPEASYIKRYLPAVPEGNVQVWDATAKGVEIAQGQTQYGIGEFYTSRSIGKMQVCNFYAPEGV